MTRHRLVHVHPNELACLVSKVTSNYVYELSHLKYGFLFQSLSIFYMQPLCKRVIVRGKGVSLLLLNDKTKFTPQKKSLLKGLIFLTSNRAIAAFRLFPLSSFSRSDQTSNEANVIILPLFEVVNRAIAGNAEAASPLSYSFCTDRK